eukprot:PLAT6226.1.p1 GENE.PLAT6226.1~~PLAT6226.1.p1  ORF type:complete len:931 (-),score=483.24 PLAT6226.1:141-2882(-)
MRFPLLVALLALGAGMHTLASPCLNSSVLPQGGISLDSSLSPVRLGYFNWESSQLMAITAKILLEEALGVPAQTHFYSVQRDAWAAMANDELDAILEVWRGPVTTANYEEFVLGDGSVVDGGPLGVVGRVGWFIHSKYVNETSWLNYWRAFSNRNSSGVNTLWGPVSGWQSIEAELISKLDLDLDVQQVPTAATFTSNIEQRLGAEEPIITYLWSPHQVLGRFPTERIFLPEHQGSCYAEAACDYPSDSLTKYYRRGVSPRRAVYLIRKMRMESRDQETMLAAYAYTNMTLEDAACDWLQHNVDTWASWLQAEDCPRGQALSDGVCTACAAGFVSTEGIACTPCPPGSRAIGSLACEACPAGTYSNGTGATACLRCPANALTQATDADGTLIAIEGANSEEQCSCRAGFYAPAGASGVDCIACPAGAMCTGGLQLPFPESGFWAPDDPLQRTTMWQCPAQSTSCLGGVDSKCADGYTGVLCAQCQKGYFLAKTSCVPCMPSVLNWVVNVAVVGLTVAFAVVLIKRSQTGRNLTSLVGRILINFLQVNTLLGEFRIRGPQLFRDLVSFSAAADGLSLDFGPLACELGAGYSASFTFYSITPPLLLLLVAVVLCAKYGNWLRRTDIKQLYQSSIIILLFLVHTKLTRELFKAFDCVDVAGTSYLRSDMSVQCYTGAHATALPVAAVLCVLYAVGIPCAGLFVLYRFRAQLRDDSVVKRFGFMYGGYVLSDWRRYWEAIVMLRKVAIVAIAVFIPTPFLQLFAATVVMMLSLLLHTLVHPYEEELLNKLDTLSIMTTLLTQMVSLLYWRLQEDAASALTVVLLVLNLVVLFIFVGFLGRSSWQNRVRRMSSFIMPEGATIGKLLSERNELAADLKTGSAKLRELDDRLHAMGEASQASLKLSPAIELVDIDEDEKM